MDLAREHEGRGRAHGRSRPHIELDDDAEAAMRLTSGRHAVAFDVSPLAAALITRLSARVESRLQPVGVSMAIRAVLSDLGGVVIRIDVDRIRTGWARMSALPAHEVSAAYPDEVYRRFERDEVTEDQYLRHVRARLRLDGTDEEIRAAFNDLFVGVDHDTLGLLRRRRERGAVMLALTNTNRTHHHVWSRRFADALDVFEKVHCSHELGCRKPELEVFRRVLHRHGLEPEEVVFIDDDPDNVHAAEAAGLKGLVFTNASTLARELATLD